ncbi:nicotinate-nicotinamide nucleotide adenylyltransferase, partial [Thauera aminoaromatica]
YAPHGRRWPATLSPALDAACAGRHTADPADLRRAPAGRVVPFDMTPLAISASLIRDLVRDGHSARYLLPESVLDYIAAHHLYR